MEGRFLIRVLGPIDIVTPDEHRRIGGRNLRAVLGALVTTAGRAVPIDVLRDVVWPDRAPPSADASLHTYVSRLRQVLGADVIERTDHSYRLAVTRAEIDAARFEDLVDEATRERDRPARCAELSRAALSLWRGVPFGDLFDAAAFELETFRLEELRVVAMELALGAEVDLGHHEIAAAELESAVREYPYREHLWFLLAEALRRDDRRVEALQACDRLRQVLAGAGLSPSAELVELERRIAADPTEREVTNERSS